MFSTLIVMLGIFIFSVWLYSFSYKANKGMGVMDSDMPVSFISIFIYIFSASVIYGLASNMLANKVLIHISPILIGYIFILMRNALYDKYGEGAIKWSHKRNFPVYFWMIFGVACTYI